MVCEIIASVYATPNQTMLLATWIHTQLGTWKMLILEQPRYKLKLQALKQNQLEGVHIGISSGRERAEARGENLREQNSKKIKLSVPVPN